jgi:hypothetical protein
MVIKGDVNYISDPEFSKKIQKAMDLLQAKAAFAYGNLIGCVGKIRAFSKSGTDVYAKPITIDIAAPTFNASLTWLASVLAHESCHAAQFLCKMDYSGLESEKECNAFQLMVLRRIGAPESEITYLSSLTGDHFDLNKDGVYDQKDYDLRNY